MRKKVKQVMGQKGPLTSALQCLSGCAKFLSVQSILPSH